MKVHNLLVTGSLTSGGENITEIAGTVTDLSSSLLTAMNDMSTSIKGMMATTGSNVFIGTQTMSGSIIPAVNNTYDLGSPTQQFRHVYISSGSLYVNGTKVLGATSQELQITTDGGQSFKILESGSDTITLQSADGNITLATSGGGDVILDPTSGIIALKGSTQVYAGNRILSSDGNAIHFGNGVTISGSLLATGTNIISGSQQISDFGYTTTSSVNTISSSINTRINSISNIQATTGSNNFVGTQTITGSLYISSDLVVQGSSSLQNITASAVNIGANIVNLNTANPAIRFAGMSIFDSGSIGGSGSFLYDSQQDEFIFIHRGDGVNITSSVVLMGAQTYNNVGNETYPTTNRLLKGTGNEHVGDSIVSETDGGIGISGSLSITGSIVATGTSLWSGSGQLPSGVISGSAQVISSLPSGTVSGSSQVSFTGTTGYSTYINQAVLTTSNPTFNSVTSGDIRYSGTGYITYDVANSGTDSLVVRKYGTTVLTLNSSGYLGVNVNPAFYLDVQSNVANTFYTIAQFENRDYTSGTRSFIRVRNWLSAGGSYSSYFGQGQDGKTYIIANNSARGGDIVIDGGNGYIGINQASPTQRLHLYDAAPASGVLAKLESGNASGWLQLTSTGTSWQIGATATGLQFWNDNETSTKLTVLTGGSILMNQDVAIRAGTSQNWILGQDSGTNLIHMGSTGVANDIRFDSSTGSGIVMIKSNGNFGIGLTTPQAILDVSHTAGTTNIIRVSNGSGNYRWRVDQGFSMIMTNASGVDTFSVNTSGTISTNSSITATTGLFNVNASSTISLISAGTNASMVKAGSGDELYLGGNDTWQMRLSGGNILMDNGGNVGIAISSPQQKLSVGGSIRANRSIYNWFQAGSNDWDGYQYLHLKTNMRSGAGGNVDHTMSLFYGRLYSYSSAYIREGHYGFHNWSGTLYNPVTTGNFWAGGYSSSDGYVVLIVALGGGSYLGINIDWHQSYPYEFRDKIVTSYNHSNSASSLY